MSQAQLQEVRFEFHGCTVYGQVDAQNQLDLHLCGHGMDTDDVTDASRIVSRLKEHNGAAKRPTKCAECSACSLGCFIAPREESLENQLNQLMQAVVDVTNASGNNVELTFMCAEKRYIFSAKWDYFGGSIGAPGYYYLRGIWTYFAKNPTNQLLTAIRNVPGIVKVDTERIEGTDTEALDIQISPSIHTSLEGCLMAVTNILA